MKNKPIIIAGAGLAGSLLAIYLAKRGFAVDLYERRPDMRKAEIPAGRSINLALSTRGIHALEGAGLAGKVLENAIEMKGRMIHSPDASLSMQPYGKNEREVIHSVSRGGLNELLLDAAESYPNVRLFFGQRCQGMDVNDGTIYFADESGGQQKTVRGATLIACDGATSAIRMEMQKNIRLNLHQTYLEHGYKELTIPGGPGGSFAIEKHALHIWPRRSYMLIALPNLDGSLTCTLFFPFNGPDSFSSLQTPRQVHEFFQENFPDTLPLIPDLQKEFFENPTGTLITIKCRPWHVGGKALLLGDSAHAIVPFYGQGMNCAFEDCSIFADCLDRIGDDWEQVFSDYQARRKADADAIADLAMDNFIEMRDSVADPVFVMKRQAELLLEERFPGKFLSKYAMVTFHRIPYAEAQRKGRLQDDILMDLCREAGSVDALNLDEAFAKIQAETAKIT